MEIRHSRRLKSDRVGEAASKGGLPDNTARAYRRDGRAGSIKSRVGYSFERVGQKAGIQSQCGAGLLWDYLLEELGAEADALRLALKRNATRGCHINWRRTQRCRGRQFSGSDGCNGFPLGHRPQAVKVS
jgi:hypothetical protein